MERQLAIQISVPPDTFLTDMQNLLGNPHLSDIQIRVRDRTIPAHKLILALRSNFFKSMFSSGMRESREDCKEIDMSQFDYNHVMVCLEEMYGRNPKIKTADEAVDVLGCASFLDIERLRLSCERLIRSNLEESTVCYVSWFLVFLFLKILVFLA